MTNDRFRYGGILKDRAGILSVMIKIINGARKSWLKEIGPVDDFVALLACFFLQRLSTLSLKFQE